MDGSCLAMRVACSKESIRSGNGTGGGASDAEAELFMFSLSDSVDN